MGVDGERHAPAALPHAKKPITRMGGPQGRSGRVRENLAPTVIRSPDRIQSLSRSTRWRHMKSEVVASLILKLDVSWRWVVSFRLQPLYLPRKNSGYRSGFFGKKETFFATFWYRMGFPGLPTPQSSHCAYWAIPAYKQCSISLFT